MDIQWKQNLHISMFSLPGYDKYRNDRTLVIIYRKQLAGFGDKLRPHCFNAQNTIYFFCEIKKIHRSQSDENTLFWLYILSVGISVKYWKENFCHQSWVAVLDGMFYLKWHIGCLSLFPSEPCLLLRCKLHYIEFYRCFPVADIHYSVFNSKHAIWGILNANDIV